MQFSEGSRGSWRSEDCRPCGASRPEEAVGFQADVYEESPTLTGYTHCRASPRKWQPGARHPESVRFHLAEGGEALRFLGWWSDPGAREYSLNFGDRGLVEDHDMYHFARALLYLARADRDGFAIAAAEANPGRASASR